MALPDVGAVPVASASCREVTEADLKRVSNAFFGQNVSFAYAPEDTREYAEEYVKNGKELYDSVINGTCENKLPSFHKSVKEQYEYYAALAKTAPSASERRVIEPVFTERMSIWGDPYRSFQGLATHNGTEYFVSAGNEQIYSTSGSVVISEMGEDYPAWYMGTYRRAPEGVSVTKEQAVSLASAMAAEIDGGLSLSHVMAVGLPVSVGEQSPWAHPFAWQCVFMREVNGVGTVYDSRDMGSDIESDVYGLVNEVLEITVDDRGVCNVRWINPLTVGQIMDPDAALLPFDAITAKLADQLRAKYDYNITRTSGAQTRELYIHHAELGLMRVGAPGSTTFALEPVWSFFIRFEAQPDYESRDPRAAFDGDPVYCDSLTVSAIDGRILDRDRGE